MGKRAKELGGKANEDSLSQNGNGAGTSAQLMLFARTFAKYPNMVGWMLPSSRWVVQDVLDEVEWDNAGLIIEYGPGLGTFTRELLQRMRPDAKLLALEINPEFCKFLKTHFNDP